jgi:hypothetical protein
MGNYYAASSAPARDRRSRPASALIPKRGSQKPRLEVAPSAVTVAATASATD